jgi:ABC-type phosphate transport system substrate-binding protein
VVKNIEDVVLEDRLMTHTGNLKIINLQRKYTAAIYDLDIKYHSNNNNRRTTFMFVRKTNFDNPSKNIKTHLKNLYGKPQKELTKNDYFGMS